MSSDGSWRCTFRCTGRCTGLPPNPRVRQWWVSGSEAKISQHCPTFRDLTSFRIGKSRRLGIFTLGDSRRSVLSRLEVIYEAHSERGSSSFEISDSGHDVLDDGLDVVGGEGEGFALGHNANRFAGAVNNDLAGLAFAKVFFNAGFDLRLCAAFEEVAELDKEIGAAKHGDLLPSC